MIYVCRTCEMSGFEGWVWMNDVVGSPMGDIIKDSFNGDMNKEFINAFTCD
jgi:hypothetical protein